MPSSSICLSEELYQMVGQHLDLPDNMGELIIKMDTGKPATYELTILMAPLEGERQTGFWRKEPEGNVLQSEEIHAFLKSFLELPTHAKTLTLKARRGGAVTYTCLGSVAITGQPDQEEFKNLVTVPVTTEPLESWEL